jgi:pimeloyl-ACP methyl ester carboxylesterase
MPVLATVGETDMPDFHEGAREMAALLPAGRAEVMEGVGHLAPLEAPERFRDMLLGFLRGQKTA